ncbi:unnamed protein product [Aureobasidium mustum]|uniref:DUF7730 domain-containing protein n=1 Tax=Aureobasidium mustum TaxID=2773714 RepID=A0A9N8PFN9_9PEZI|nr:unnamed protein product [Aureobasidium mustum]
MSKSFTSKKKTKLVIPDDLGSTNACAHEPLYGDDPKVESQSDQVIVRSDAPSEQTKQWKWPDFLLTHPRNNVFSDSSKPKSKSTSAQRFKHKLKTVALLPGMLRLPVEIRNQIYGYLFHQQLITIKQNDAWPYQKGSPLVDAITEYREPDRPRAIKAIRIVTTAVKNKVTPEQFQRKMMKARGVSYDGIPGQKPLPLEGVKWETSLNNLLLTCKTLYAETGPILYGITVFYFDDAQRLRAFLKTVSDRNLACITKLHIHVRTYGIPNKAADNVWFQEHVDCWTKIFAKVAKKMTNLRTLRVTLTMRNVTDGLKYAFRPTQNNTDWRRRAGYMLMLRPVSTLNKLEDLRVSIKATDNIMAQYDEMLPLLIYRYWELANVNPIPHVETKVMDTHRKFFEDMQNGLEQAMTEVARSKNVNESFAPVCLVTRAYMEYLMDPIGHVLIKHFPPNK